MPCYDLRVRSYGLFATRIINYIGPFLDACEVEKGLSDYTQKNYRGYLALFGTWLKSTQQEHLRPRELTAELVWDYRLYIAPHLSNSAGIASREEVPELLPHRPTRSAALLCRARH